MRASCSLRCVFAVSAARARGLGRSHYVETASHPGSFTIAQGEGKTLATICVDAQDYAGVIRAANDLQADIVRVTAGRP